MLPHGSRRKSPASSWFVHESPDPWTNHDEAEGATFFLLGTSESISVHLARGFARRAVARPTCHQVHRLGLQHSRYQPKKGLAEFQKVVALYLAFSRGRCQPVDGVDDEGEYVLLTIYD